MACVVPAARLIATGKHACLTAQRELDVHG